MNKSTSKQTRNQTETNAGSGARNMNTNASNEAPDRCKNKRTVNALMNQQHTTTTQIVDLIKKEGNGDT